MSNLFAPPSPSVVNVRPKPNRLDTPDKAKAYETVVAHFSDPGYQLEWHPTRPGEAPLNDKHRASAGKAGAQVGPLNDDDKMFLTKECIIRFLVADDFHLTKTIPRLEEAVRWRKEMGIDDVASMGQELQDLGALGKFFTFGYGNQGQPLVFWDADTKKSDPAPTFRTVRSMFFMTERAMDLMVGGVEEVGFILDLGGKVDRSWAAIEQYKHILHDVQRYYPERLGFACVQHLGMMSKLLVNVMWPFVDPNTKSKVSFDAKLADGHLAQAQMIPKDFGGAANIAWDGNVHYRAVIEESIARRNARAQRWSQLGGVIGLSELDIVLPLQ